MLIILVFKNLNIYQSQLNREKKLLNKSITNLLRDNIIQDYFHSDLRTKAFEILLKEKVQFNPVIDMKVVGYKKYNYEREKILYKPRFI